MLGNEQVWTRQHGGSVFDVMLTVNYEVIPANADYYQSIASELFSKYLLVPTRGSTVAMLTIIHFLNSMNGVHVIGNTQSGKTSLMYMLDRRINFSPHFCVEDWSEGLKKKFMYVRRDGEDWLVDLDK